MGLASVLNLWGLGINGWANTYYSAAVRSMTASWHDFLFVSLDRSGLMSVDKPPLSLWVQALSARVFGFHPLSLLVPQALMGVLAVWLLYDLTARRFGRIAGFVAGLALATTPVVVAVSRHNNPDELLLLCSVSALWCALRALDTGRARWLMLASVAVGLGFETKMGVALFVVPGIALAWLWTRVLGQPTARARRRGAGQLLWGGIAMVLVAGAWPLLVMLTPANDRPWISGTSDNSIWSLVFGYNGIGRIAGQAGGPTGASGVGKLPRGLAIPGAAAGAGNPGGPGGSLFGGATGPLRLLHSGLGDQAGWLLGFAVVSALGLIVLTRMRRRDPRTAWLLVVGGAFLCTAVVFSFAGGIFHPYYVSLLAPFGAALVGAGIGVMLPAPLGVGTIAGARWLAPLAILGGVITELAVLGELNGQLGWARPVLIGLAIAGCLALVTGRSSRVSGAALAAALVGLLAAPTAWAAQTLGHAANGTFPAGGPATAGGAGPGGLAPGGGPGAAAFGPRGLGLGPGAPSAPASFGPAPGAPGAPAAGGPFGGASGSLPAAIAYARAHGGGTIGVASQSSAAAAIIADDANVAGLGGFSGRESSVSIGWLATEVRVGRLNWVMPQDASGPRLPGDSRAGSTSAFAAVTRACRPIKLGSSGTGHALTIYDCRGAATSIIEAGAR